MADGLAARGVRPARTLEVGSTEAIKQVVAAGLGLAIVSAATVRDQVALGRLTVIPWRDFSIKHLLWRLRKPGRLETPVARAFGKLLEVSTEGMDPETADSSRKAAALR